MAAEQHAWADIVMYQGRMMHVTFSSSAPTQEQFQQEFLDTLQQVLDASEPFTLIVDSTQLGTVPLSIAFEIVRFMKLNQPKFRAFCQASAIVVSNAFIQNLLDMVFTLSPPVSPNIVVQNVQEAFTFVQPYHESNHKA